jgi:hypothetical protein
MPLLVQGFQALKQKCPIQSGKCKNKSNDVSGFFTAVYGRLKDRDMDIGMPPSRGRNLGRNWDKSLKSFPPSNSQSSQLNFLPPSLSPSAKRV